jgi:small subunit ribosomal protein S7
MINDPSTVKSGHCAQPQQEYNNLNLGHMPHLWLSLSSPMLFALRRPLSTITRSLSTVTPHPAPLSPLSPVPSTRPPSATPSATSFVTPAPPPVLDIPPAEDPLLQFMTKTIMRHGKRKRASRTISRMLLWVHSLTRAPPLEIVREAILLSAPAVRTMSHTHGGKIVSRPIALSEKQRTRYAVKWILKACDNRPGQTLEERLAREVIATVQGTSSVLVEKERAHTFAMVNRYVFELRFLLPYRAHVLQG